MSKGFKEIFHQRKDMDGKESYEYFLNIISYYKNRFKPVRYHYTLSEKAKIENFKVLGSVWRNQDSHTAGGNAKCSSPSGNHLAVS